MAAETRYAVLWPRSRRTTPVKPLAARPPGLEGKKVAFLWDYLFRGDEIFPMLEAELGRRFPGMTFVDFNAFGSTHGANERRILEGLPEKLREMGVDAVVSGMGC